MKRIPRDQWHAVTDNIFENYCAAATELYENAGAREKDSSCRHCALADYCNATLPPK